MPRAEERLRQTGHMLSLLIVVGGHGREARIREHQPRHLADAEDLFCRQNAIPGKDPAGLSGLGIAHAVTCVVDEIILFVHQQHREFERVARLGASYDCVLAQRLQDLLGALVRRIVLRTDANGGFHLVLVTPGVRACSSTSTTAAPSTRAPGSDQSPGAGSAMMSALSLLLSAGGEVGGGDSRVRN